MTKPVEEMSMEEIQAERAALAAARGNGTPAELDPLEEFAEMLAARDEDDKADENDESEPVPWPHQHMEYAGLQLEVRKPNESALVAISMTGVPSLGPQGSMKIFTQFLVNHLSPESFATVVITMTDPDSGIDIQGLVTALTKLEV